MTLTLALAAICFALVDDTALYCPVMKEAVPEKPKAVEYAGLYVPFCCSGCDHALSGNPAKYIDAAAKEDKPVAMSLFDPVTGVRLDREKAKGTFTYKGVLYVFSSETSMTSFKSSPESFAKTPKMESFTCPMSGDLVPSAAKAAAYFDHEGVRYYVCCEGCVEPLRDGLADAVKKNPGRPLALKARDWRPADQ